MTQSEIDELERMYHRNRGDYRKLLRTIPAILLICLLVGFLTFAIVAGFTAGVEAGAAIAEWWAR